MYHLLSPNTQSVSESITSFKEGSAKKELLLEVNSIWMIQNGVIKTTSWNEDGIAMTLGIWGKGDLIGYPLSKVNPYNIECLSDVKISRVLPDSPLALEAFISHCHLQDSFIEILHQPSVRSRLIRFFHWLASRFGQVTQQGQLLNFQLTHQDIADTICSTRVTVTRLIGNLENEGIISRSGRFIIVGK